jgi:hypothetical protein
VDDPTGDGAATQQPSVRAQSPMPPQPDGYPQQAVLPTDMDQGGYYPDDGAPGAPQTGASGYLPIDPFGTRFSFRSDIGNGPGWAQGFQALNGFVPITFEPGRSLLFLDGRAILTNNGQFTGSAGAGLRYYSPELDRVMGGAFWYDYDNSTSVNYDQWGVSLESLGRYFDMRLNAYVPSNNSQTTLSSHMTGSVFFIQDNIGLGSQRTVQNALRGGDFEIGGALPFLGDYGVRSYIGAYYFQAPTVESTVGVKWRSELLVTQNVVTGISASSDKLFGQNFFGSVTIYMPDGRPQRILSRQPVQERLYTNMERNYRVNIYRRELNETLKAINPDTGLPYIVHHVDNNATAGSGNGKVKNPFGTLSDAATGADIIFVHHNAVDSGNNPITAGYDTGIVLNDNQRLLGQGTEHLFTDLNHGTFALPGNDGGPAPLITNLTGDVVTLANHNEVSGFQIGGPTPNNPAGNGIFGSGITDFNINRNSIQNADLAGISLVNASGTGTITMNNLSSNGLENISIINNGAPALTLDITNNSAQQSLAGAVIRGDASDITATIDGNDFSHNTNNGLDISAANGGTTVATVTNNVFNSEGGNGFQAASDAGTMTLSVLNNSANSNTQSGFDLGASNGGTMSIEATDNAINSNTLDGLHAFADNGTIDFTNFSFNTLNANGQQGITLDADNGGILNGTLASNSLQNNSLGGLDSTLNHGSQSNLTIQDNTINGNTGFGLSFSALNGSLINNTLNNNTIQNNVGPGVLLSASNSSDVKFAMNGSNVSNNQGIGFDSSIANSTSNITLTNNVFNADQDAGVRLGYTGATTATQLVDGNTITNTTDIATTTTPQGEGIIVNLDGTGGTPMLSSTIQNNTIQNNVSDGIQENLNASTSNVTVNDVVNNNLTGNGRDGINMQLNFGSIAVLNASNNIINTSLHTTTTSTTTTATNTLTAAVPPVVTTVTVGNTTTVTTVTQAVGLTTTTVAISVGTSGVNGIEIDLQADSKLTANITDNSIIGSDATHTSTGNGVLLNIEEDGVLSATLTNNLIRANGLDGVHVGPDPLSNGQLQGGYNAPQGTATIGVTLNQNTIELNKDDGVQVSVAQVTEGAAGLTGVGNYTLDSNIIRNNGTFNASTNTRTGDGINAEVRSGIMNFVATNNTISGNASDGILLRNSMGAAVDGGVQVPNILSLTDTPKAVLNATIDGNMVIGNGNRGINIRYEDTSVNADRQSLGAYGNVSLTNNTISGNRDEGVLVVMNNQRNDSLTGQNPYIVVNELNPFGDPTAVANEYPAFTNFPNYFIPFANADVYSDLKFTAVGNTITDNGGGNPAGATGLVAGDGMLLLVGTSSYLHADVRNNQFGGNFLDDFRTDSFISQPETLPFKADFNGFQAAPGFSQIFLDHISLMDLRFTGNTGNSIGGVTSSSDSDRDINGVIKPGRYNVGDYDSTNKIILKTPVPAQGAPERRRTDYFRIEDTPSPAGSVLNSTNSFSAPDSTNPRNNFLNNGFIQVPIGSLFP